MPTNAVLALQLLIDLATAAVQLGEELKAAQAAGTDITDAQLDAHVDEYKAIHAQLEKDLAAKGG